MTKTQKKRGKIPEGYGSVQLHGRRWWLVYRNSAGIKVQENSGTGDREEAERELARRSLAVVEGIATQLRAVIDETGPAYKRTGGDSTPAGQMFKLRAQKLKLVENDVKKACVDLLGAHGYKALRQQSGGLRTPDGRWITVGEPGLPDYAIPAFMVETKRPGARLSEVQQKKIWELENLWKVEVAVVDRVEALAEWLREREQSRTDGPGRARGSRKGY
jgi:hypothetical protein